MDRDLEDELRFHLEMKAEETRDAPEAQRRLPVGQPRGRYVLRVCGRSACTRICGLYAVIAHSVKRTQEIGVRMAIGGTRRAILRLVYAQGMRPLALGMATGLPAAFGLTHVLRTVLVGVSPGDPATFAIVVLVLTAAGVPGCAIPAHRAIRVDPIVALRYE